MTLTVLTVGFPFAPLGPDAVGGAEQVATRLDVAITAAGHRSIVVGCEGSAVHGTLLPIPRVEGLVDDDMRALQHRRVASLITEAMDRWPVSVVHMHGLDFQRYLPPAGVPVLATLHLPPEWYAPEVFHLRRPSTFLNCVSAAQQRACPPSPLLLPAVENGVALEHLGRVTTKRGFLAALGRVCPEKGFHLALDAARLARSALLLAGRVFPYESHERYFRDEILPRLDRCRRFVGPVGPAARRRLLGAARCLLAPSLAPETSSLVAMEALACGTPVIAFPAGALPDIVEHGRTGYIVRDVAEMAEAVASAAELNPEDCRAVAVERFSAARMSAEYLALYERLAVATAS